MKFLKVLTIFGILLFLSSCVKQPYKAQLDRFDSIPSIPYSSISELYDFSNLKIGSEAIYESHTHNSKVKLIGIRSNQGETIYIIEMTANEIVTTYIADSFSMKRALLFFDGLEIVDVQFDPEYRWLEAINPHYVYGGLIPFGLNIALGLVSEGLFMGMNADKQEEESMELIKNMETKIIGFELISHEDLIFKNQSISCNVYQIHTLQKIQGGVGETISKIWISNQVPFGIVKREVRPIMEHISTEYKDETMLIEFNY